MIPRGNIDDWFRIDGDNTLRVDYTLDKNSTVLDLGAYEGRWFKQIAARYGCRIFAFEPSIEFYNKMVAENTHNTIRILPYGIGVKNEWIPLAFAADATSFHTTPPNALGLWPAEIRNYHDAMYDLGVHYVDLMKINIEGGEYSLLNYLYHSHSLLQIKNIQVQFHNFIPDYQTLFANIQRQLSETHELTYDFGITWQNWRLK